MTEIRPFTITTTDEDLDDLRRRLHATRWPEAETVDGWSQGIPLSYVQELCRYWADDYDWRAREARLNEFPQFTTTLQVDGTEALDIHFVHVRSPHEDATPLIMTHGWPGSIAEFQDVIGSLTDPLRTVVTLPMRSTSCARRSPDTASPPNRRHMAWASARSPICGAR